MKFNFFEKFRKKEIKELEKNLTSVEDEIKKETEHEESWLKTPVEKILESREKDKSEFKLRVENKKCLTSIGDDDCNAHVIEELKAKNEELKEESQEQLEQFQRVVDDDRAKDEVHCSCCVELRVAVEQLEKQLTEKDKLYTALTSQATGNYGKIDWLEKKVKEQKGKMEMNAHDNLHEIHNGIGSGEKEEE